MADSILIFEQKKTACFHRLLFSAPCCPALIFFDVTIVWQIRYCVNFRKVAIRSLLKNGRDCSFFSYIVVRYRLLFGGYWIWLIVAYLNGNDLTLILGHNFWRSDSAQNIHGYVDMFGNAGWHEEIGGMSFPLTRYRKHVKNIFALCPFIKTYPRLATNHLFNIYKMYKIYHCSLYPITKKSNPKSISLIIHLTNTIDFDEI